MAFDIDNELPDPETGQWMISSERCIVRRRVASILSPARQFYLKYDPQEVIGKGLSSVVRKCVEKSTGKEYACKIVEFNDDDSEEERAATLREIQILRLVGDHPNIIDVVGSFETPAYIFIVMELCPNGELFDYLTQFVRLSGCFPCRAHSFDRVVI